MQHRLVLDQVLRSFLDAMIKRADHRLQQFHFCQREQEGQSGFRALVLVDAIHMQGIVAAPGARRVKFEAQVVPAEKPIKGA